jgi:small subunit ribosomal protein S1
MTECFADLFEQSLQKLEIQGQALITGTVIALDGDMVIVDVGLKSECAISRQQFLDTNGELEVSSGDAVTVALEAIENGLGYTQVSREKARRLERWQLLERAYADGMPVDGMIMTSVKGGFSIDLGDLRAFLPGSLVDIRPLNNISHLIGQTLQFKLLKLDAKRDNIVVSRRALLEQDNRKQRECLLANLQVGAKIKGTVKNLTDYGAFIDLGGLDGLLHITDITWKRIRRPSDMLSLGDEIEVVVLKFDHEKQRVSLGMKQLTEDPWLTFASRNPVGSRLQAQVTTVTDYGCFAQVEDGIEGLIHASEMSWMKRSLSPGKLVHQGQQIEVMLLNINLEKRRLSLGMKQCRVNPWLTFAEQHKPGNKITGIINSKTDFGLFLGLSDGIDGLVHVSDISWQGSDVSVLQPYHKGDSVEAVILSIDTERERVALSIKKLQADVWLDFVNCHKRGQQLTGQIQKITDKAIVVALADGVNGFLKQSELGYGQQLADFKQGNSIVCQLLLMDRKKHSINLSIKAMEKARQKVDMKNLNSQSMASDGPSTLGDLIKEQMGK